MDNNKKDMFGIKKDCKYCKYRGDSCTQGKLCKYYATDYEAIVSTISKLQSELDECRNAISCALCAKPKIKIPELVWEQEEEDSSDYFARVGDCKIWIFWDMSRDDYYCNLDEETTFKSTAKAKEHAQACFNKFVIQIINILGFNHGKDNAYKVPIY